MIKRELLGPVKDCELPGHLPWKENAERVVTGTSQSVSERNNF